MTDELDRFNTVIQIETDSEESIETSSESSSSPESSSSSSQSSPESSSSKSLDFENEHNIFITNTLHQKNILKSSLQQNFNNKSGSTPDFYCFSCKNRYFINIIGSTMTHCALCSSSTTKLHNNNVNNVHFSDYNGWKEFTKGWSGL